MSPILVVLEGPDGSGKTRHVRALTTALTRAQIHAEWFNHQPTALNVCAAPDPWSAALHYATERDRLRRRIERGSAADVVVCDRWWHSTVVFSDLLRDDRTADCFEEALAWVAEEEASAAKTVEHWEARVTEAQERLASARSYAAEQAVALAKIAAKARKAAA